MPTTDAPVIPTDECYRCGYDLRTIANAQPCPECGLLAERSRRVTDELHNTRPRWLRSLSLGIWLILLSLPLAIATRFATFVFAEWMYGLLQSRLWLSALVNCAINDLWTVVFIVGVLLLTVREHYPPADASDARLRRILRWLSPLPLLSLVVSQTEIVFYFVSPPTNYDYQRTHYLAIVSFCLTIIAALSIPPFLFERLRTLARRARSAHLAEHCRIVSLGSMLAVAIVGASGIIIDNGDEWFGSNWSSHSKAWLYLMVALITTALLFLLWSLYLLLRFAWAFHRAARQLRRQWKSADRGAL